MATAEVEIPSSNYGVPGSLLIQDIPLPTPVEISSPNAEQVISSWLSSFNDYVKNDVNKIPSLFFNESYWRDQLCLTWDFHTLHGPQRISSLLQDLKNGCQITSLSIDKTSIAGIPRMAPCDFQGELQGVQSFLVVETRVGRGRGVVRLLPDSENKDVWKAFTLFTTLQELKDHEEFVCTRRLTGAEHGSHPGRMNWQDRRIAEEKFDGDLEPTVLIVGAGQGGLTLAARLKQLGVSTLIIDRNPRVGDNWRNRYHQLVLHDTVWFDHMPYLNFPPNWPVFTPKDKLAEWFELYAKAMELNVWTSTNLVDSKWDDVARKWTISLEREKDGRKETRNFHPNHVVQATGHSGEPYLPSHIKGFNDFQGDRLVHSSYFTGPQKDAKGKKAVVVGCCNSGHDIAQDYYEHGYDVTMVQRSSTLVTSCKALEDVDMKDLYEEGGPPVEDADLISMSFPNPVLKRLKIDATREMSRRDATLLQGLRAAGFALDSGPDGAGLFIKYLHRGGGYYINTGASQLIVDGKIKIKQGQEIERINAHSVTFADGSNLEADEIVFATGFQNMRETARKIFGDGLADGVKAVWGFDEEGETRTMWRRTGHPGFWFFGGNLMLCRYYSRLMALQIKALEVGLMKYEDP